MAAYLFAAFCLVLQVTKSLAAEPAGAPAAWNIDVLMNSFASVKKSRASFVERKYLSILKTPLEFSGTLHYFAPGHLEKHTLKPKAESMVLDQDKLTLQNAEGQKRTLAIQDNPAIWAFVESFRSTLAGDLKTLQRFYRVTLEGDAGKWRLVLQPLDTKMKAMVDEIRIDGSAGQVNTIEVREAGGDHSMMSITPEVVDRDPS